MQLKRNFLPVSRRRLEPGANPIIAIASYNASAVKFYNATNSLARFENKNIFLYF
jgi:hypothetical protein